MVLESAMSDFATRWIDAVPRPAGVKARVRAALRSAAINVMSLVPREKPSTFLRGLYCHYVFDDQRSDFERVIRGLLQMGRFVDTPTYIAMLEGRQEIDGRYFHLSFDDGFRNIFCNAAPILSALGVPAIVFVPSAIIEADWRTTRQFCLETARYAAVIEMMTWDDLRTMVSSGFEVGSHTRTHTRLSEISNDPGRLEYELAGSKLDIERALGGPCRYIAWPFGTRSDVDDASLRKVADVGYEACFGAFRGSVVPGRTDRFRIPRHQFEAQWSLRHIKFFASGNMEA
jgi:peptidoglycan/xylan/chitin deacetylase (PgdA/CDA1 family)